jgi:transposase
MNANLFWFTEEQWAKIEPHLPTNQPGPEREDDRRILSGIMHVQRSGCRWKDCPSEYGPAKTIYNRFARWSGKLRSARTPQSPPSPGKWPAPCPPPSPSRTRRGRRFQRSRSQSLAALLFYRVDGNAWNINDGVSQVVDYRINVARRQCALARLINADTE